MADQDVYLRAILATIARKTFPPAELAGLIVPSGSGEKQIQAYNMCDGQKTQGDVAKALSLDTGNFSRTVARWVDIGIAVKIGEGKDVRPMHLYPLPEGFIKKAKAGNGEGKR